jgi:hypothetical protein
MRGFLTGMLVTAIVWACGWERVAAVLDTADAAAKRAVAAIEQPTPPQARHRRVTEAP